MKKVLELGGGDECTAMGMYLMLLNHLRRLNDIFYTMYILHNKMKERKGGREGR